MPVILKNHIYRNIVSRKKRRCIDEIIPIEDREVPEFVYREFEDVTDKNKNGVDTLT